MSGSNNTAALKKRALERFFSRMNDMQREAVFSVNGPVLILAGAGSGKTTVLVNRIANMIYFGNAYNDDSAASAATEDDLRFLADYADGREDNSERLRDIVACNTVKPWSILAITFTNKAAGELKDRIAALLGESASGVAAATFHSACARILRREIDKLGYGGNFTIYDSDDSQRVMKSCLEAAGLSEKQFPPRAVLSVISSAKDKLLSPADVEREAAGDFRLLTVAKLYAIYSDRLKSANALDFDDIIKLTVELFEKFPDVLEHYQNLYKYIMVDEYQDTNMAQFRLVELLSKKYNNICVVGDDDQSIYKFRGATIENILSFEDIFSGCKTIRLEQNYRSTQNILSAANSIIKNNSGRKPKSLWTDKGDGERITVLRAADERAEGEFVTSTILDGIKDGGSFKDYAVLYRMNAQSNSIERAMVSAGIPYRIIGGLKFYDRKEIKDMTSYLAVINNPTDMLRFRRIINEPKRGIGESTLSMIEQISSDLGESPVDIMRNAAEYPLLSKKAALLRQTAAMFDRLTEAAEESDLPELLDLLLAETGYAAMLEALGDEGETRRQNIEELKSTMVTYSEEAEEPSLSGFLEEISLYTDVDKLDSDADAVTLMTIHSAKGLEFEKLFIVGMEEGIFPGSRSLASPEDLEEERRLAYVAVTRARSKLYITNASQRMLFGSTSRNTPSRFIKEIDPDLLERVGGQGRDIATPIPGGDRLTIKGISLPKSAAAEKPAEVTLKVGDRVSHKTFGEGTVLSVNKISNDAMVEIAFDRVGTKKLMANYARLTVI